MTLCLNMIVKNESSVILETLQNIVQHVKIDHWVIHDTGSSDNTAALIEEFFETRGIPGQLIHKPWENFGKNRQYALQDALGKADYVLFFDADDRFEGKLPKLSLTQHAYSLNVRRGTVTYPIKMIVKNDGSYRWRGVVHEAVYFTRPEPESTAHIAGDYFVSSQSIGARSTDQSTYYRDAMILASEIENLPQSDADLLARYTFYCANSWRDAGSSREAIAYYQKRIALGGWQDEVYLSYLGLGIELLKLNQEDEAILAFMKGHGVCPERAECIYHLARTLRAKGDFHTALIFAEAGSKIPLPDEGRLFIWHDVYRFWMHFEQAMALKGMGAGRAGPLGFMLANDAPAYLMEMAR